jgi:hypothetical protein
MPAPVPNHEADKAARYSLSALGGRWELPAHKAHLTVASGLGGGSSREPGRIHVDPGRRRRSVTSRRRLLRIRDPFCIAGQWTSCR